MDAVAEGQMRVGIAADVEALGVGEGLRIAVGRVHEGEDALAAPDQASAELDVVGGDARQGAGRPVVAQPFLDGARRERRVGPESLPLFAKAHGVEEAVADQVGRGLVAGEEQQDRRADHLVRRQRILLVARQHQPAQHVAGRLGGARLDQTAEIAGHQARAFLGAPVLVAGDLRGADEQRDVIRPCLDPPQVVARHAQHVHDHAGGQRIGEVGDEVDRLAACGLRRHAVEQLRDDALDVGAQALDRGRREDPGEQAAQARMVGRILEHHPVIEIARQVLDAAALIFGIGLEERRQAVGGDLVVVERDAPHVVVARDDPRLHRRRPVHRILLAQPREFRERIGIGLGAPEVEDVGHGAGRHIATSPCRRTAADCRRDRAR